MSIRRQKAQKISFKIAGYIGFPKLSVRSQADARVLRGKALLRKASGQRIVEDNRTEVCADASKLRGSGNAGQIHKTKWIEFRGADLEIKWRRFFFRAILCGCSDGSGQRPWRGADRNCRRSFRGHRRFRDWNAYRLGR